MKQSALESKIAKLIQPVIQDKGYDLVCVSVQGTVLQIMAENPATRNLGIDECVEISREVSTVLEVEDPISGAYRLEVSSPGIDRPLVKLQDFADFAEYEVRVEISPPLDGQRRFRGVLKGTEEADILLETDTGLVRLPFDRVERAKLVMTESLLKNKKLTETTETTEAKSERGTDD